MIAQYSTVTCSGRYLEIPHTDYYSGFLHCLFPHNAWIPEAPYYSRNYAGIITASLAVTQCGVTEYGKTEICGEQFYATGT